MRTADQWLNEYGESHQNPTNKLIHWICVPAIVISLIGLLWSIPVPAEFVKISPAMNWGTVFLLASVVYYFVISISLAIGMAPVLLGIVYVVFWLDNLAMPLWQISIVIFVVAWIFQFVGHKVEGKAPSFFKDVQFLMIGPMWLLSFVYRKLGIPY